MRRARAHLERLLVVDFDVSRLDRLDLVLVVEIEVVHGRRRRGLGGRRRRIRRRLRHRVHRRDDPLHAVVVRRELDELLDELAEDVGFALLLREARHLLLDFDRLRRLPDGVEGTREEAERVEVFRVLLEADLELRERLEAVVRLIAREVQLGRGTREAGVLLVVEEALEHLDGVVAAPELRELRAGRAELRDGAVEVFVARERLGEPEMRQRVRRIEIDDAPEHFDRFGVAPLALQPRRDFVERCERVADEAELLVELRQLRRDVAVFFFELREMLRDDLADLLVDGDRFEREPLTRVVLADALVGRNGVRERLHLRLEISNLEEGPCVVRILLDQLLVLENRLVVLLLLDELLGGREHLFAVDGHGRGGSWITSTFEQHQYL